jgi:hypothetical protein
MGLAYRFPVSAATDSERDHQSPFARQFTGVRAVAEIGSQLWTLTYQLRLSARY